MTPTRGALTKRLRIVQFIVIVMVVCLTGAFVYLLMHGSRESHADDQGLFTVVLCALIVGDIVAFGLVRQFFVATAQRRLREETDSVVRAESTLQVLVQISVLVTGAIFGCGLFAAISYYLAGGMFSLVILALAIMATLAFFPTLGKFEQLHLTLTGSTWMPDDML